MLWPCSYIIDVVRVSCFSLFCCVTLTIPLKTRPVMRTRLQYMISHAQSSLVWLSCRFYEPVLYSRFLPIMLTPLYGIMLSFFDHFFFFSPRNESPWLIQHYQQTKKRVSYLIPAPNMLDLHCGWKGHRLDERETGIVLSKDILFSRFFATKLLNATLPFDTSLSSSFISSTCLDLTFIFPFITDFQLVVCKC